MGKHNRPRHLEVCPGDVYIVPDGDLYFAKVFYISEPSEDQENAGYAGEYVMVSEASFDDAPPSDCVAEDFFAQFPNAELVYRYAPIDARLW